MRLCTGIFAGLFMCAAGSALAQSIDADRALVQASGKVVHLMVTGKSAPFQSFPQPIHGSGIVIRTNSPDASKRFRILTAGHVVMPDSAWAPLGSRVNRDVYVIADMGVGSVEFRPVTGVRVSGDRDIAEVVANPSTSLAAEIKAIQLTAGQQYAVVSWGLDGTTVAEHPSVKLVKVLGPDDGDPHLVKLQGNLVPTESGSPMLDDSGAVVAIVVQREVTGANSNVAFALPIAQVADWVSGVQSTPVAEPGLQRLKDVTDASGLCVFLGKKSALARGELHYEDAPFGREFLQQVLNRAIVNPLETAFTLTDQPLRIAPQTGAVNIRSRCPEVRNGRAFYGSPVAEVTSRTQILIGAIRPLHYLNDTFFWGTIAQIIAPQ